MLGLYTRADSSMAEHVAHNDLVTGSNPVRPTTPQPTTTLIVAVGLPLR